MPAEKRDAAYDWDKPLSSKTDVTLNDLQSAFRLSVLALTAELKGIREELTQIRQGL